MSERKVLNKYFPPDFDPSLIPRRKQPKNAQQVVRLMAPFSMRCNTCGEYIYKGKKFNARKETVEGEDYYGIKIFRFYIKCTLCSAEITFKTDPKNTDYAAEHGASRNFEPWREEQSIEEEDRLAKLEEEENNPMKALENRTTDSKREMDILDALQDIRARNARNERVGQQAADELLERIGLDERKGKLTEEEARKMLEEEEDEKLVREVFSKIPIASGSGSSSLLSLATEKAGSGSVLESSSRPSSKDGEEDASPAASTPPLVTQPRTITVKRKADDAEHDLQSLLPESTRAMISSTSLGMQPAAKKKKPDGIKSLGIKIVKKGKKPVIII